MCLYNERKRAGVSFCLVTLLSVSVTKYDLLERVMILVSILIRRELTSDGKLLLKATDFPLVFFPRTFQNKRRLKSDKTSPDSCISKLKNDKISGRTERCPTVSNEKSVLPVSNFLKSDRFSLHVLFYYQFPKDDYN